MSPVPVTDGLPMPTFRPTASTKGLNPDVLAFVERRSAPAPVPDEFQQAREATRERRLAKALLDVGEGLNTALTGTKSEGESFDVDAPMRDLAAHQADRAQKEKTAREAALRDPNSAESIRMRALLGATGSDLPADLLSKVVAEDGPEAFQVAKLRLDSQKQRDEATAAERKRVAALEEKKRQEALAEERRKGDRTWQEGQREADRKSREKAAAITAGDKATQQKLENETGLRKEFSSLPPVREFADTETNFQALKQALKDKTGMGATTAVFSVMKILDPGVAVMQGDVDLIRQSGGKAAALANVYDSALKGNPLSDAVRADILRQAQNVYESRKATVDKLRTQYFGLASEIGVNPDRVVLRPPPDVVPIDDLPQGGGKQPAPAPSAKPQQLKDVPFVKLKPGQTTKDVIQEGQVMRGHTKNGVRLLTKRNGKIVYAD